MTIREFYEWACEHGCEDSEFGVSIEGDVEDLCERENMESCMEVVGDEIEIGSYYGYGGQYIKDFVWLNIPFNEMED